MPGIEADSQQCRHERPRPEPVFGGPLDRCGDALERGCQIVEAVDRQMIAEPAFEGTVADERGRKTDEIPELVPLARDEHRIGGEVSPCLLQTFDPRPCRLGCEHRSVHGTNRCSHDPVRGDADLGERSEHPDFDRSPAAATTENEGHRHRVDHTSSSDVLGLWARWPCGCPGRPLRS